MAVLCGWYSLLTEGAGPPLMSSFRENSTSSGSALSKVTGTSITHLREEHGAE
jgi:hypothetical protein